MAKQSNSNICYYALSKLINQTSPKVATNRQDECDGQGDYNCFAKKEGTPRDSPLSTINARPRPRDSKAIQIINNAPQAAASRHLYG